MTKFANRFTKLAANKTNSNMFNLSRYASLSHVVRNFGVTRKLFASTSVLAEKEDPTEAPKVESKAEQATKANKSQFVASVFESLKNIDATAEDPSGKLAAKKNIDIAIMKATTVNGLLNVSENRPEFNRKHALKVVSILAEWSTMNKIKLHEFENDGRFTKLCRMLGRATNIKTFNGNANAKSLNGSSDKSKELRGFHAEDLNMILGVTGDDEAAKLIGTITLPQMVKVMKNLSLRKRRSTPLLRSLAYAMNSSVHKMDLHMCVDVLYSMANLNFPEPILLAKICESIQEALKEPINKSIHVGSCVTSLAMMRYRDPQLLDALTEWICNNQETCRTQDSSAIFQSLAVLNHLPSEHADILHSKIAPTLSPLDFKKSVDYLGFVWSLMMLNHPNQDVYNTVLGKEFIDKLVSESRDQQMSATSKMKLLNINACVKLFLPTYSGAMLNRESQKFIYDVPLAHNRGKQVIVNGMIDAIKSVVPENCLKLNNDTSMGFVTDAEFYTDGKGNPVATETSGGKRIALVVHDYHDMCQGPHQHVNGIAALNLRLLSKSGYHVITVPYNEFSISDNLLKRVQYLDNILKAIKTASST